MRGMSRRSAVVLVWAVLFAALPVPFYMGASGFEPPLGIAFLAGLAGGIWCSEGGAGTTSLFAGLAIAQALAYLLLTGLVAQGVARLLFAWAPRRAHWGVAVLCAGLVGAALFPIYDTPLSSSRARSNVLQLFR
jgi:hypothetical protein